MPNHSQVTLLPTQLSRLAELFPTGGAVGIRQDGSTVLATNGVKSTKLDAQGEPIPDNPDQESLPLC